MNEKKEPNLDELLNSYLDGELDERQLTEIKRLILNDPQTAAKLQKLKKIKDLLGALPKQPAPPEILHGVKAYMARKARQGKSPIAPVLHAGTRHLLLRRTMAAAAMIALISVLALLVFNILKTEGPLPDRSAELYRPESVREVAVETPKATIVSTAEDMEMESLPVVLVLKTNELRAVNSAIGRAIYDSGLLNCTTIERLPDRHVYSMNCGQENTSLLTSDLKGLWERFDTTSLSLARASFGQQVTVDNITAEQLATILAQRDIDSRAKLAKDFAALNAMATQMPGRDILTAVRGREHNLLTVDKPVLTSNEGRRVRAQTDLVEKVSLTIVVKSTD
jgi:hypothetical protein